MEIWTWVFIFAQNFLSGVGGKFGFHRVIMASLFFFKKKYLTNKYVYKIENQTSEKE